MDWLLKVGVSTTQDRTQALLSLILDLFGAIVSKYLRLAWKLAVPIKFRMIASICICI